MNTTVCEGNTATFTCIIFYPSGIFPTAPTWTRNGVFINTVIDMMRHNIVDNLTDLNPPVFASSTLTVSRATTSDDGIMYRCGASGTVSNIAILNVAGMYVCIHMYVCTYYAKTCVALVIKTIAIFVCIVIIL